MAIWPSVHCLAEISRRQGASIFLLLFPCSFTLFCFWISWIYFLQFPTGENGKILHTAFMPRCYWCAIDAVASAAEAGDVLQRREAAISTLSHPEVADTRFNTPAPTEAIQHRWSWADHLLSIKRLCSAVSCCRILLGHQGQLNMSTSHKSRCWIALKCWKHFI